MCYWTSPSNRNLAVCPWPFWMKHCFITLLDNCCQQIYCSILLSAGVVTWTRSETNLTTCYCSHVCVCVSIGEHTPVCASLWSLYTALFPNKSGSFAKPSAWKWKPVLSQFLVKDSDVTWFKKIDGSPHMLIMNLWSLMILICICLPGNNSMLWSNVMLFCSCLPG